MTLEEVQDALKNMSIRAVCCEIWGESQSKYERIVKTIRGKRPAYYDDIKALSDYLNGRKI